MSDFQARCIAGTEAELRRRGMKADPNRLDQTITLADAKRLIAADVYPDRNAYTAAMKDLRDGQIVLLADHTCIRYYAETRAFRHWL